MSSSTLAPIRTPSITKSAELTQTGLAMSNITLSPHPGRTGGYRRFLEISTQAHRLRRFRYETYISACPPPRKRTWEGTQIKKKRKFSSYIRKFKREAVAKSYNMRKGFRIHMRKCENI